MTAHIVGPDAASDKPFIVDTIGAQETTFRAWAHPGTKANPSRWSARLSFFVHYKDAADDDVVVISLHKGKKRLGKPTPCRPKRLYAEAALAAFECEAPKGRDHKDLFSTKGVHTIKLTYRKVIEGKEFANFAVLTVNVEQLKKGASNNPSVSWGESHDGKLTVSTIEEKSQNSNSNSDAFNALAAAKGIGVPYMLVSTWFKREKRVERTKMTCMYKGKRIAEAQSTGNSKYSSYTYKKKGSPERIDQAWEQATYFLYAMHPRPDAKGSKGSWSTPQHWLNENPGDYKCVITGDGEIVKELYFKVGADGEVVKPACQRGSMNALKTVTLLRTVNKKLSTVKYDKKVGKKAGYEGRVKWSAGCPL